MERVHLLRMCAREYQEKLEQFEQKSQFQVN